LEEVAAALKLIRNKNHGELSEASVGDYASPRLAFQEYLTWYSIWSKLYGLLDGRVAQHQEVLEAPTRTRVCVRPKADEVRSRAA
jgi:hypothetical protein